MDTWDNQPTPVFDDDEAKRQMEALEQAEGQKTVVDGSDDDDDSPIKINDPQLRDTVVEGYVICNHCDANNYIRNLGIGDTLICESCEKEITIGSANITHSGSGRAVPAKKERPTSGSLNLESIGKYKIEKFVALGGMGEVYEGHHPNLNIRVAIKVLSSDTIRKHPQMRERFMMEAQTAARMNHANVCRVYDADMEGDLFYIVMEFIPGGDVLQMAKKEGGRLEPQKALNVIIGVAEALKEAAKFKIVHRDIKPENIMIAEDGTVKLADLGIAKSVDVERQDGTWSTFTNAVLGTPGYIAPEQSMNARDVDSRSDIYSLGATFYHLVTGSLPFKAASPFQMMYKHVKEPLTDPREMVPELPENMANVIKKMMEKAPEDRYQTADELLKDLYKVRDKDGTIDSAVSSTSADGGSPSGGGAGKWVAAAILGVAALVVVGLIMTSNKPQDPDPVGPKGPTGAGVDTAAVELAKQRTALITRYRADFQKEMDEQNFDGAVVVAESLKKEMPDDPEVGTVSTELAEKARSVKTFHQDFEAALSTDDFKSAEVAIETLEQTYSDDTKIGYDLRRRLAQRQEQKRLADEAAAAAAEEARLKAEAERIRKEEEARAAAAAEALAAKQAQERAIKQFRDNFDRALNGNDLAAAQLAVDALKRSYPDNPALYDMQVALQEAQRKNAAQPRITAAKKDFQELANLRLDPGQGFGDKQAAIETALGQAEKLFAEGKYLESQRAAEAVSTDIATLIRHEAERKAARPLLAAATEARKLAKADGGSDLPELAPLVKDGDLAFKAAQDAFDSGRFDQVAPQAQLARNLYGDVVKKGKPLLARNAAKKSLDAEVATVNLDQIKQHHPDLAAEYEKQRRLGDASGDDYQAAAKHYIEALDALRRGESSAKASAATAERNRLVKIHEDGYAAARAAYDDGRALQRRGDLQGMKAKYEAALASLAPTLAGNVQAVVPDSQAPELKATIEEALSLTFSKPEEGKSWMVPDIKLKFTWVEKGSYTQGSSSGKDASPRQVTISRPFWMGTYEVTQRQYSAINSGNPSRVRLLNNPVDSLTYDEAAAFCRRLTEREKQFGRLPQGMVYRLPTEAEWEYACRAGTSTKYSFGDDYTLLHKYGNYRDKSNTAPVSWRDASHDDGSAELAQGGKYQPNKWGIYDMHGNLREWCLDWYGGYGGDATDPTGPSRGDKRVVRGGAWTDSYEAAASWFREADEPNRSFYGNGLRVVLGPPVPGM